MAEPKAQRRATDLRDILQRLFEITGKWDRLGYYPTVQLLQLLREGRIDMELRKAVRRELPQRLGAFIAYVLKQWKIKNALLKEKVAKDIIDKARYSVRPWFTGFVAVGHNLYEQAYAAIVTNSKTLYTITDPIIAPAKKADLREKRVVSVAVGSKWAFAVTSDGKMWSWCTDDLTGATREVTQMRGKRVKQVAAFYINYYVALVDDGTVWTGSGDEVDLDNENLIDVPLQNVVQIASNHNIMAAVTEAGEVWTWGESWGRDATKVFSDGALQVAVGRNHIVTRTNAGDVYVWGAGRDGQLGLGNNEDVQEPTKVYLADHHVVQVAAGNDHTVLLTSTGEVLTCGNNDNYQLAWLGARGLHNTFQPIASDPREFFVCVAANYNSTMLVTTRGKVYCYGEVRGLNINTFNAITGSNEGAAGASGAGGGGPLLRL